MELSAPEGSAPERSTAERDEQRRNLKLLVEYDGTPFVGWQSQRRGDSVQEALERAFLKITQTPHTLRAAGRTDAGVHARAQVVSCKTASKLPLLRLARGLNATLPPQISVHSVTEVPDAFDAKRDSCWKRYRYSIYQAHQRSAHWGPRSWHIMDRLNVDAMRAASRALLGEIDFESFRAAQCQAEHARREMFSIDFSIEPVHHGEVSEHQAYVLHVTYHANAFVRHMCRILTGTLVQVGRGDRDPASMAALVQARDRTLAGPTAPPHGLCMMEVGYLPWLRVPLTADVASAARP